jgi:hypothetical protein
MAERHGGANGSADRQLQLADDLGAIGAFQDLLAQKIRAWAFALCS